MLPKSFVFSPVKTFLAILLATAMLWASSWQWERYKEKKALLAEYKNHSVSSSISLNEGEFSLDTLNDTQVDELIHKKVKVRGELLLDKQIVIINRRHEDQSGFWLMAPMKIEGNESLLWLSRGFIPFEDGDPSAWSKYDRETFIETDAVVQKSVGKKTWLSPANDKPKSEEYKNRWKYPEIPLLNSQIDALAESRFFLQRLGASDLPAESITFRVPPSTHFGYAIEWILLAVASLVISFLLQAFPRSNRRTKRIGNQDILSQLDRPAEDGYN